MLAGGTFIDSTLFTSSALAVTANANPLEASQSSTTSLTLNPNSFANDGTATTVTARVTTTVGSTGVQTTTSTVTENGTGFVFLTVNETSSFTISQRAMPLGFSGLAANGTGRAFTILRISATDSLTRTFNNTSSSTKTLVAFGSNAAPATTATQQANATLDTVLRWQISLNSTTGQLTALIDDISSSPEAATFLGTRTGGPAAVQLTNNISNLVVGGTAFGSNGDIVIPVGNDARTGGVSPTGGVSFSVSVGGGIAATTTANIATGAFVASPVSSTGSVLTVSSTLNQSSVGVNDGIVDHDPAEDIMIASLATELTPTLSHSLQGISLSGAAIFGGGFGGVLYLPEFDATARWIMFLR